MRNLKTLNNLTFRVEIVKTSQQETSGLMNESFHTDDYRWEGTPTELLIYSINHMTWKIVGIFLLFDSC